MNRQLFRPGQNPLCCADIADFYANIAFELERAGFSPQERTALVDKRILGRMVDPDWHSFFVYHFSPAILCAADAMFATSATPILLELGCGSGTISLLFALMGARVLAVDIDPVLLSACRKRQVLYELEFGPLELEFRAADVFGLPYEHMYLDGAYSIFAFNLMQPSRELLPRIATALKPGGKLAITDGNRLCLYNRLIRPRPVLSMPELEAELALCGCRVEQASFECSLPSQVVGTSALFAIGRALERIAKRLGLMRWLGVSYNLVAQRDHEMLGTARPTQNTVEYSRI